MQVGSSVRSWVKVLFVTAMWRTPPWERATSTRGWRSRPVQHPLNWSGVDGEMMSAQVQADGKPSTCSSA
jgi:hypothetical protein